MDEETCDYYELKKNSSFCKHFIGDMFCSWDTGHCSHYCSLLEDKKLMRDNIQPLVRVHGALRHK